MGILKGEGEIMVKNPHKEARRYRCIAEDSFLSEQHS